MTDKPQQLRPDLSAEQRQAIDRAHEGQQAMPQSSDLRRAGYPHIFDQGQPSPSERSVEERHILAVLRLVDALYQRDEARALHGGEVGAVMWAIDTEVETSQGRMRAIEALARQELAAELLADLE